MFKIVKFIFNTGPNTTKLAIKKNWKIFKNPLVSGITMLLWYT